MAKPLRLRGRLHSPHWHVHHTDAPITWRSSTPPTHPAPALLLQMRHAPPPCQALTRRAGRKEEARWTRGQTGFRFAAATPPPPPHTAHLSLLRPPAGGTGRRTVALTGMGVAAAPVLVHSRGWLTARRFARSPGARLAPQLNAPRRGIPGLYRGICG